MTKVLSIDWDYFVEEDPRLDFGHRENGLFLSPIIWATRKSRLKRDSNGKPILDANNMPNFEEVPMETILPFRGDPEVLAFLPCLRRGFDLFTAESHQMIVEALKDKDDLQIVNIDAHHDLFYNRVNILPGAPYDCGSWGAHLINQGRVKSFTQIYPKWRQKFPEVEGAKPEAFKWAKKKLGDNFKVFAGRKPRECFHWTKLDTVFICRSGCWTPPEYDAGFNRFVKIFGGTPMQERKYAEAA